MIELTAFTVYDTHAHTLLGGSTARRCFEDVRKQVTQSDDDAP